MFTELRHIFLGVTVQPTTKAIVKINELKYSQEYYSAIQKNEIVPFSEMWMDLEIVIQGEVNQKEKNKYLILTHICGI